MSGPLFWKQLARITRKIPLFLPTLLSLAADNHLYIHNHIHSSDLERGVNILHTFSIIHSHTLSYTLIHYHTLSYTIIHYHTLSYTLIHSHTLSYTLIHSSYSRFRFVCIIVFSLNSRRGSMRLKGARRGVCRDNYCSCMFFNEFFASRHSRYFVRSRSFSIVVVVVVVVVVVEY